jgi:hypothetical protein
VAKNLRKRTGNNSRVPDHYRRWFEGQTGPVMEILVDGKTRKLELLYAIWRSEEPGRRRESLDAFLRRQCA